MKKEINVGLIGYKFMGKAHSHAYKDVAFFFPDIKAKPIMKVICGRDEKGVKTAKEIFGWEEYSTSYKDVIKRKDIDLIDISTTGSTHCEIAIAAAENGKHILCEKPLANNLSEARKMVSAVKKAGVKSMVCFNYRRVPAIQLAKKMISDGELGTIYHFRGTYLQDWIVDPNFPLVWRLKKELAGSGAHGDLNAHIIDLARFLVGDVDEVVGMTKTFIKERPIPAEETGLSAKSSGKKGKVTVDDATLFLAKFNNGAIGSFEATRFAIGRKNFNRFEINGSKGSIAFNFERMNELEFYSLKDKEEYRGFRTIIATEPSHAYIKAWWPAGHPIGYEHTFVNSIYDLMNNIVDNKMPSPDFVDGMKCQEILEAVSLSANEGRWVKIKELKS